MSVLAGVGEGEVRSVRAIWKGAVSFGLVNVPVRLFAATQEHDIRFHQVHREDGGRIRMKRTCSIDGEEVPYDHIAKGYESPDGRLVILTDEDFADLPLTTGREIEVVEFVPVEQVDPVLYGRTYYLEPEARAAKPYVLLREALEATQRLAVVKVAMRQRESLAVLRVRDRVIVLQTLLWPDEVRAAEFDILEQDVEIRPQELVMAQSLVESLATTSTPTPSRTSTRRPCPRSSRRSSRGRRWRRPPRSRRRPAPRWSTCSRRCSAASSELARAGATRPPRHPRLPRRRGGRRPRSPPRRRRRRRRRPRRRPPRPRSRRRRRPPRRRPPRRRPPRRRRPRRPPRPRRRPRRRPRGAPAKRARKSA